jgi:hypothetical protein
MNTPNMTNGEAGIGSGRFLSLITSLYVFQHLMNYFFGELKIKKEAKPIKHGWIIHVTPENLRQSFGTNTERPNGLRYCEQISVLLAGVVLACAAHFGKEYFLQ